MNRDASFGLRHLTALGFLILLSPALRLYPLVSARLAGRGAWLSAAAGLPLLLGLLWLLCRVLARRQSGEGLAEIALRVLGERPGRFFLALLSAWLLLYGGFVLRAGADRFVEGVFPKAPPALFSVSLGLACLLAALGRKKALLRLARLLLPALGGVLLFLLLLSLRTADWRELLPLTAQDLLPVLTGSLPVIDVMCLCLYLPALLCEGMAPAPRLFRRAAPWLCGAVLLLGALCAAVLGSFGAELTQRLSMPFFALVRNLVFLESLERMDALVISLWIFPDFLLCTALLFAASHSLRLLLHLPAAPEDAPRLSLRNGRWLIWLCGAAVLALSLLLGPDAASLARWSERIVPLCNLALSLLLIPGIYLVGKIRKTL